MWYAPADPSGRVPSVWASLPAPVDVPWPDPQPETWCPNYRWVGCVVCGVCGVCGCVVCVGCVCVGDVGCVGWWVVGGVWGVWGMWGVWCVWGVWVRWCTNAGAWGMSWVLGSAQGYCRSSVVPPPTLWCGPCLHACSAICSPALLVAPIDGAESVFEVSTAFDANNVCEAYFNATSL
jgi:hypothetical protein